MEKRQKRKKAKKSSFSQYNIPAKALLLVILLAFNEVAKALPAEDLTYFHNMLRLDYLYASLAIIDKDLRGQLIGLSAASILSHYLQLQDYINRTPITELIDKYYFDIQPFLYHSLIGVFVVWAVKQGYIYVSTRKVR